MRNDGGYRADLIIEDKVIAELKSVENSLPANKKQTQTYLRLTGNKLGYLLSFGGEVMKTGITRCVNGLPENVSEHCLRPLRPCVRITEHVFRSEKRIGDILVIRTAHVGN